MEQLQQIIEQLSGQMVGRLSSLQYVSEQEYEEDCQIITEFNKIAAGMLQQEPGIELPGATQPIPLDDKIMAQALCLFSEGIYFSLAKCAETGITGELKKNLLQNLAMEVYGQSKQVVAATYGQESTPDFQFSMEQQVEIINKATEGHLVAFITEYEQEHGPIQPEVAPQAKPAELPAPQSNAPVLPPQQAPEPQPTTPAPVASQPQNTSTPHDKYGAVALLLTTLPASQRTRILKSFTNDEKELIAYYSDPRHIEQNLNLASVEAHLKKFKEFLQQGNPSAQNPAFKGIAQLAKVTSPEKLLSCVKDERPMVKRYLQAHYADKPSQAMRQQGLSPEERPERQPATLLPPRIEEILYRYLSKRLTPG